METDILYVVANPNSGSGRGRLVWKSVEAYLSEHTIAYQLVNVDLPPEGSRVMLIGGDGTYCCFVNRVPRPEVYRYVLVEAGSSNSLWSTFGTTHCSRNLDAEDYVTMDLGEVETETERFRFWNEASLGFAAAIGARTVDSALKRTMNRWRLSEWAYVLTAFSVWMTEEPTMINLMNNNRISGDLRPCPDARPDDGQVDVSMLRCPRWRLPLELVRMVGLREANPSRYVEVYRGKEWRTELAKPLPVEADGEPMQAAQVVRFGLYSQSLQVKFWKL